MKNRSHRSGGFTLVIVVFTIAFAGMAIMAISSGFIAESRRTRACAEEAQLRQLLLVGAVQALDDLSWPGKLEIGARKSVTLPPELASHGATVEVVVARDSIFAKRWQCDITAILGKSRARQRVTFELGKAGWVMVDAQLR